MPTTRRSRTPDVHSRLALMAGFGGLLLLMAFAEIDGVRGLREIQNSNDEIRENFLLRTRLLERIRGDVYVSGTYVRDYLLEPEAGKAEGHRYSLLETRHDMDAALNQYRGLLKARGRPPFEALTSALEGYWSVLEPVFHWTPEKRKRDGFLFLRDEVFPRRQAMLEIADQIRALNETQLNEGKVRVEQTFADLRQRLTLTLGFTIGLGLLLAAFSIWHILRLEAEESNHLREIQQLSARLVEAQEDERRSISRELHDEVGQSLTGVLVEMANLSTSIRAGDVQALAPKADEIKKLVESSIGVVRNLALL